MDEIVATAGGDWRGFVKLAKFDETTGEGEGILALEQLDKTGEVFDYESSKPYFKEWAEEFSKATEGRSVGNLRVMHTPKVAGRFTSIAFDDASKSIPVKFVVTDPVERMHCAEGDYTGLSVGGKYVKKWTDAAIKGATRYTAKPAEGSLVDNPAMPGAKFVFKSADGAEIEREFRKHAYQVWYCGHENCHERHVAKAEALACEGKIDLDTATPKRELPDDVKKCLYCVAQLASITQQAKNLGECYPMESTSTEPTDAKLDLAITQLHEVLIQMAEESMNDYLAEESAEAAQPGMAMSLAIDTLSKAVNAARNGPRISAVIEPLLDTGDGTPQPQGATMKEDEIEKVADAPASTPDPDPPAADLQKVASEESDELRKAFDTLQAENGELRKRFDSIEESLATLVKTVASLPGIARAVKLSTVTKGQDTHADDNAPAPEPDDFHGAMRKALSAPVTKGR